MSLQPVPARNCLQRYAGLRAVVTYLKAPVQIRHFLRVLALSYSDALLHLFRLSLHVFSQGDKLINGGLERPNEWFRIEGCRQHSEQLSLVRSTEVYVRPASSLD